MLTHPSIRIGDVAQFPIGRLGDREISRRRWEAIAFRPGIVMARRRHDGITRELADHWWRQYAHDWRPACYAERRSLPLPRLNADRTRPGFYVSVQHARKPGAYVLAAGPFSYPGDAARVVAKVRAMLTREYGDTREWWDLQVGTCKVEDGTRDGKWNREFELTN